MSTTIILVHGAFAGQFAWGEVKPILEKAGRKVLTLDLPAHGDDQTPVTAVSFESYLNAVIELAESQTEKITLVGHSMAGVVISAVAEKIPAKIDKLVYLSAYLPQNGESLQDLAGADAESLIGRNLIFAPDYSSATLPDDVIVEVFAGDCDEEIKKLVIDKKKPEPLAAFQAKAELTVAGFGSVPKYYIETLKDEGVGNILQRKMVEANGEVVKVFSLDCGHSAYFAKPEELASILTDL